MNLETMSHDQAVSSHAPERYLLGELDPTERDAFEGHYFDCTACFDQVKKGSQFLSYTGEVLGPEPEKGWFARLVGDLRRPAPAFVTAALLVASGIGTYQQVQLADARKPKVEARLVFHGAPRGQESAKPLAISRKAGLSLKMDFTPSPNFTSYQARIVSDTGKLEYTLPLSGENFEDGITLALPANALAPGKHSVVIQGLTNKGDKGDVAGGSFDLRFID